MSNAQNLINLVWALENDASLWREFCIVSCPFWTDRTFEFVKLYNCAAVAKIFHFWSLCFIACKMKHGWSSCIYNSKLIFLRNFTFALLSTKFRCMLQFTKTVLCDINMITWNASASSRFHPASYLVVFRKPHDPTWRPLISQRRFQTSN
jgi:hypothetical protein